MGLSQRGRVNQVCNTAVMSTDLNKLILRLTELDGWEQPSLSAECWVPCYVALPFVVPGRVPSQSPCFSWWLQPAVMDATRAIHIQGYAFKAKSAVFSPALFHACFSCPSLVPNLALNALKGKSLIERLTLILVSPSPAACQTDVLHGPLVMNLGETS